MFRDSVNQYNALKQVRFSWKTQATCFSFCSPANRQRMTTDPNNPEVLTHVANVVEAAAIVDGLASHGIQASTTGSYTAGFQAEAPGTVQIIVKASHLDRAREALSELEREFSELDWSQIDVGKPDE